MSNEIGDAEDKYRRRIDKEDDLILTSENIVDIMNGQTVIKSIPVKINPRISYSGLGGPGGDGDGDGDDDGEGEGEEGEPNNGGGPGGKSKVKVGIDARRLKQIMENWGLKFTKPGKKNKKLLQVLIAENGINENQEKTIEAMLDRQMATGEFKKQHGFKVNVRDEDLRYDFIHEKSIPNQSATFIIVRDVSGSMAPYTEFSATIAGLIEFWLRNKYENNVKVRFVAHTDVAWEIGTKSRKDFFKLISEGSTAFNPVYQTILAMMEGKPYDSQGAFKDRIKYEEEDVFVLHITDGDNNGESISPIKDTLQQLIPKLTKLFYLQVGLTAGKNGGQFYNGIYMSDNEPFYDLLVSLDKEKIKAVKSGNDASYQNVKKVLDQLLD
jgi:hypothetical protein